MSNVWEKIDSRYVLENPWYKVRQDKIVRPDGKAGTYNVVECSKTVFIVPVTSDNKIVLIKQFRYTTQREGWELPAGSVEKGESPLEAAKREFQEETGFTTLAWEEIDTTFDSMNGMCDAIGYVFVARNLTQSNQHEQEEEGISQVEAFTLQEILAMIQEGKVIDALSIASLMKFFIAKDMLNKLGE